jgi:hypothetical protein
MHGELIDGGETGALWRERGNAKTERKKEMVPRILNLCIVQYGQSDARYCQEPRSTCSSPCISHPCSSQISILCVPIQSRSRRKPSIEVRAYVDYPHTV